MLYVNTNFAIDHFVSKITWIIESQSHENTLLLVRVNLNYDKVNQIAHVRKARGSLEAKNMAVSQ